jgi:hypothetical protein
MLSGESSALNQNNTMVVAVCYSIERKVLLGQVEYIMRNERFSCALYLYKRLVNWFFVD